MKNYYKILGVKKKATEEEIRACWTELVRKYHPDHVGMENSNDQWIKEINEAYDTLKHSSTRVKYDLERAYGRKKGRSYTKKLVIPLSLVIIPLILGSIYLYVKMPQVPSLSKRITQSETNQTNLSSEMRSVFHWDQTNETNQTSQIASKKVKKVVPQEEAKVVSPIIEPSLASPVRAERELESKEKQSVQAVLKSEMPVEIAKVVPKEVNKEASIPSPSAPGEELRSREKPSTQTILKSEIPVPTEKVVPKEASKVVPQEMAKVVPQTDQVILKDSTASRPRGSIDAATQKRIDAVDAKDAIDSKTQLTQQRIDPIDAKAQSPQLTQRSDGPGERISAKSSIAEEEEVRQFFTKYVERYIQKDLDGFLSFFSSKAVQNQKEGFDEIRKIYANFFNQTQHLTYQLGDLKIEIHQNTIEAKTSYEVDQTLKKRGKKRIWRGPIRWTLVKENGTLRILSLDYQHQKSL